MSFIIRHTPRWVKNTYLANRVLSFFRERSYAGRYYTSTDKVAAGDRKTVIFRVDGRFTHGGLCDRFWGCLAVYNYCRRNGLDFKIDWRVPFDINTFFEPSEYNWVIRPEEVSFNPEEARLLIVSNNFNQANLWRNLDRIGRSPYRQVHIYTPAHLDYDDFGMYFKQLFKPTPVLQSAIDAQKREIGGRYVSISFRFMQLLGDFKDMWGETLDAKGREDLLQRSLKTIEEVRKHHPEAVKVLVTSDSSTMLDRASEYPWVHIIPGKPMHIDLDAESGDLPHLKTLLDFMMIAGAEKVYFGRAPKIYGSTFAETAARVNNTPFERLDM